MKRSNWYFRGYERREELNRNGKGTSTVWVYTGDWYGFPEGKQQGRKVKLICGVLSLLVTAFYLHAQLNPALGGRVGWLGGTSMLAFVPLMFEAVAFASFLPAGEQWEYRVYYAGYRRLLRAACALAVILVVWLLLELWFLLQFPELLRTELFYLLAIVVCVAAQAVILFVIRKNPVKIVKPAQQREGQAPAEE